MNSDRKRHGRADDALERRLREEAAARRSPTPAGLRESILSGLEAAPGPTRNMSSTMRWGLLAAAGLAATLWFASSLAPFGSGSVSDQAPDLVTDQANREHPLAEAAPNFLEGFDLARVFVVTPSRLGATVEEPLMNEMQNLARDTRGIALTFYAGIPTPIQNLIGLGLLR